MVGVVCNRGGFNLLELLKLFTCESTLVFWKVCCDNTIVKQTEMQHPYLDSQTWLLLFTWLYIQGNSLRNVTCRLCGNIQQCKQFPRATDKLTMHIKRMSSTTLQTLIEDWSLGALHVHRAPLCVWLLQLLHRNSAQHSSDHRSWDRTTWLVHVFVGNAIRCTGFLLYNAMWENDHLEDQDVWRDGIDGS